MTPSSKRVAFKTLGCKLNQAETEAIASAFKTLGWTIVEFGEQAHIVVVNTCTVTNTADAKSRSTINKALKLVQKEPSSLTVVTGCYVDGHWNELPTKGAVYYVPNAHKNLIPQIVEAYFRGEILPGHFEKERDPFGCPTIQPIFRTRAMIKIQDGCDNFCTFCIIPFVRSRAISRPLEEIIQAIKQAITVGYKEIVFTGVNMSRWRDGTNSFHHLLESCLELPGQFRLRLGSIEPDQLDENFINLISHPKMTPHAHLCLQSGSEKILLAMRRQYTASEYEQFAIELRQRIPNFNLTTDVIVGFPGETEEDFYHTESLCQRLQFGHIHTFPYSLRTGTRAERMENQIAENIKKVRGSRIRHISELSKRAFRTSLIGSVQEVLVERVEVSPKGNLEARGLSANYVPIRFPLSHSGATETALNQFYSVHIQSIQSGKNPDLMGCIHST